MYICFVSLHEKGLSMGKLTDSIMHSVHENIAPTIAKFLA